MRLSIVIVSYQTRDVLERCLESLGAAAPDAQLVVVDNASTDGTAAWLREHRPDVQLIAHGSNAGFPAGANAGLGAAAGEFVLLLNPDTEVDAGVPGILIDYLAAHDDVGIIGPRLLGSGGSAQVSAWRTLTTLAVFVEYFYLERLARLFGYRPRDYGDRTFDQPTDVDTLSGAAIAFRRSLLDRVGLLDPELFWIEDADFCLRTRQVGLRVVYHPGARILHHSGVSARRNELVAVSNQIFNKIKFMRKYGTRGDVVAVTLISLIHVLAKILALAMVSTFRPGYLAKLRAYFYTLSHLGAPPRLGGGL